MRVYSKLLSDLLVNGMKGTRKGIYYRGDAIDSVWKHTKAVNPETFPWSIASLFLFFLPTPMDDSVLSSNGPDLLICV